jgi:endoglucanase
MSATPEPVRKETGLPFSRGVNLGNCLEAPTEGAWGLVIQDDWLPVIRDAGFDHIRLPVKWSGHAGRMAPYTIDEKFLARVDHVIQTALDADLGVVLNVHHYDEMATDPEEHFERLSGIWTQLAAHYADLPDQVAFELMNEPNKAADVVWPELQNQLYQQVRNDAPDRWICVTNGSWSSASSLTSLELSPAMLEDERLFATFHFYEPFKFTHQHASWVAGADAWGGTLWDGNQMQQVFITKLFDGVAQWSAKNGDIPVLMGEFGAYSACDPLSRERWTTFCAREAERRGFAWSYWEFASGFGIYSRNSRSYDPVLLKSLIP